MTQDRHRNRTRARARARPFLTAVTAIALSYATAPAQQEKLPTIRRTHYGVPHILADDFHGIGLGLGYAQVEDYGARVVLRLVRARGELGRSFGRDSMESDFRARLIHQRAVATYHLLDADTRGMLEGFAEGVNLYIRSHPDQFGVWARPNFTGHDVAALDIGTANLGAAQRVVQRELQRGGITESGDHAIREPRSGILDPRSEEGSNAWAFAPSRTKSGRAILLRNPHLAWDAGYWEAHVTIPGVLNFYGDFRIGGPFGVIGGFNQHLGWSTTNNAPDNDEVYALDLHPWYPNHYWFDGAVVPMRREDVLVDYRTNDGIGHETRTFWSTP
ncbi:MAG TPA: penicillin acylase family protein, partial [Longimicrobiales bacterium]|nr:penicillin acylase family protein [Longimicrobiales bacterium]